MLASTWKKNDKKAIGLIIVFSVLVFLAVTVLSAPSAKKFHVSFNPVIFAEANAVINSIVALLLIGGLIAVKNKNYLLHKRIMMTAISLSVLFLVSYICHHLFAAEARYGDLNHDGVLSNAEKTTAGNARYLYFFILGTHIPLAGIALPVILFTAYRALIGEYDKHKKLVRVTWPLWFYVAVTGVLVYFMISPYYP